MTAAFRSAVFAAVALTALEMMGASAARAMPVNGTLAALVTNDSVIQQARVRPTPGGVVRRYGYARPYARRYGYARPYYRRYGYARPYGWGPSYYAYGPAYYDPAPYYWAPRYRYWGAYYYGGPAITFGFGFGPRLWW